MSEHAHCILVALAGSLLLAAVSYALGYLHCAHLIREEAWLAATTTTTAEPTHDE